MPRHTPGHRGKPVTTKRPGGRSTGKSKSSFGRKTAAARSGNKTRRSGKPR